MNKVEQPIWPSWLKSKNVVQITARNYETVLDSLRLDLGSLRGKKVLSVGEGLSDFVNKLREKGIEAYGIDPIYQIGAPIFSKDYVKIAQLIGQKFPAYLKLEYTRDRKRLATPDKRASVAGSVYRLPFEDNQFDLIVSNYLFEHIDLALALPELVRITKDSGEIRLGGARLQATPSMNQLIPGTLGYDGGQGEYFFGEATGFETAMQILAQRPCEIFVTLDNRPRRSEVHKIGGKTYTVGALIVTPKGTLPHLARLAKPWKTPGLPRSSRESIKNVYQGLNLLSSLWKVHPEKTIPEDRFQYLWKTNYHITLVE